MHNVFNQLDYVIIFDLLNMFICGSEQTSENGIFYNFNTTIVFIIYA